MAKSKKKAKPTKTKQPKEEQFASRPRKKGTYYDKNRIRMRTAEQERRRLVREGKLTPTKRKLKGKEKSAVDKKQAAKKRQEDKNKWKRDRNEQRRLAQLAEFLKEFPAPNAK